MNLFPLPWFFLYCFFLSFLYCQCVSDKSSSSSNRKRQTVPPGVIWWFVFSAWERPGVIMKTVDIRKRQGPVQKCIFLRSGVHSWNCVSITAIWFSPTLCVQIAIRTGMCVESPGGSGERRRRFSVQGILCFTDSMGKNAWNCQTWCYSKSTLNRQK